MGKWTLHTPDGVQDTLFEELKFKRMYENTIMDTFESCGYFEIETPTYEFYDVFEGLEGINQENCFKFFDREGRILTLRPDLTTPISRVAATKFSEDDFPLKVSYLGSAFRYDDVQKGGRQREFTQAGIEFLGDGSPEADAEVIAVTIKALLALGITDFKIDIGQIMFFMGLMEQAGFSSETINSIKEYVNLKDSYMLEELLKNHNIPKKLSELIAKLPELFGDIEMVDELLNSDINSVSKKALENLKEVYEIIKDYGFEKYISVDLGFLKNISYYTGIIFKGFTHGVGFPICGGGRYDNLSEKFGKKISSTGSAISVSRLAASQLFKVDEIDKVVCDATVYFNKEDRRTALEIADYLRETGLNVETRMSASEEEDMRYVTKKDIYNAVFVNGDKVKIVNLKENTVNECLLSELFEDDCCCCEHGEEH